MTDIVLTKGQSKALFEIRTWFTTLPKMFWRLSGPAGTGKSVLLKFILECDDFKVNKEIAVVAFSHKAVGVLRSKGIEKARTLHSTIYKCEKLPNGEYIFTRRTKEEMKALFALIIVDEASMISFKVREDLAYYDIPILYAGDYNQLPPIGDHPLDKNGSFMLEAETTLNEIMRQALDSPIIRLSMDIREGRSIRFGKYGDGVWVIHENELTDELLLKTDQIIVGKNNTRRDYNYEMRKLKGLKPNNLPALGEELMVLENLYDLGLFNSSIITSNENRNDLKIVTNVGTPQSFNRDLNGVISSIVLNPYIDGCMNFKTINEEMYFRKSKKMVKVDFSYAITTHKCQGSSYRKPIVIEERMGDMKFHKKMLYTAVTRAEKKLILVRP